MDKKPDGPKAGAIVGLGLGMVVCCVGFALLTAGALSGLGAWLFDGGLTWLVLALVLGAGGVQRESVCPARREAGFLGRRVRRRFTAC